MPYNPKIYFIKQVIPKVLSLLLVGILFYPILPLFLSIFTPSSKNFEHIINLFIVDHTITTILLLLFVTLFSFLIALCASILVSFYKFPFSNNFKFLLILPLTIPTYFGAYIYDKIFDYSGIINSSMRNIFNINHFLSFDLFSFWGGVFIFTLFLFPYLFIILLSFFRKHMAELIEVARTLGASPFTILIYIIMPLAKFPIMSGLTMIMMEIINDFGVTSYLGIQTFSASIFKAWFSLNDIALASKLSGYLVPVIFLFLILSKKYSSKKSLSFVSNHEPSPFPLKGKYAFLATVFCSIIFIISYVLPVLILGYYSYFAFIKYPVWNTLAVMFQTIFLIVISTLILLILGLFLAYQNRRKTSIYTELFSLQYALPSIIIAVAILNTYFQLESWNIFPMGTATKLQNLFVLVIFAYVTRFMILSYNVSFSAFKKIGFEYQQISQTLGYTKFQTFFKIELPLILPSILIGSTIIMIDLFKELPLTLFLSPFNFETLSTSTHNYVVNEMFTESTPSALVLIFIIGFVTWGLFRYSYYSNKGKKL